MVKTWWAVHRWSSLVCTAFLLLVCLTGLPLIFESEIEHWRNQSTDVLPPAGTPRVSLDHLAALGRQMYPGQAIISIFLDDDAPAVFVRMAPSSDAAQRDPATEHLIRFNAYTAQVLGERPRLGLRNQSFTGLMLGLHKNLFAGLAGDLFVGVMGLLFLIAIVSGVVLYGPYTRKLDFGVVRTTRSARIRWLDLHNLLGIVTLAWALVVGATGVMNELATPLFGLWQRTEVKAILAPYAQQGVAEQAHLTSPQHAVDTALAVLPGRNVLSIGFPSRVDGSPWHYVVWLKGDTPLTSRLFNPVLVDARTGALAQVVQMPWYLRALEVSRPLHFGDYAGLPLKILWAVLDLMTIVVLGSGLYLWIARRKANAARLEVR